MKHLVFIFFIFFSFQTLLGIPINDTSILRDIVLVTENTVDATVTKYPYIIMLYYDIRDEICKNFYYEFLKLRTRTKDIHPEVKLGVFEMAPTLNTAEKLRIHKHPHVKLFIHGIENEHFSHHYRPFQSHEEIFDWAKSEIHRTSQKPNLHKKNLHQDIKIPHLSNFSNFSSLFKSSLTKVIYCSPEPHIIELEKIFAPEGYNINETMQKLHHAFSRENAKFYIAPHDFELCQKNDNVGNILIFGSHEKHTPNVINPRQNNIREISKIIKKGVHQHILNSKNHDFIDKLWKTHKPLVLLFLNAGDNYKDLIENIESLVENQTFADNLQFGVVDFQTSHGKTLFERFRINLDDIPLLLLTHDISHKSKKYVKKIDNSEISHFKGFLEKYFKNEHHEHRIIKSKRAIIHENHVFRKFEDFIHLNSENFNETIDKGTPMIVLFYFKETNFDAIMNLYEHILSHVRQEYDFEFKLATFDLFHNDIDNIGYYNIERMPAVFFYLNNEDFIDLTDFSHNHDIRNILYVLERQMKDKSIKYHSSKAIKTAVQENHEKIREKGNVNKINMKNEL